MQTKFYRTASKKRLEIHNPYLSKTLSYQYCITNYFLGDKNSSSYNNFVLLQRKTKAFGINKNFR